MKKKGLKILAALVFAIAVFQLTIPNSFATDYPNGGGPWSWMFPDDPNTPYWVADLPGADGLPHLFGDPIGSLSYMEQYISGGTYTQDEIYMFAMHGGVSKSDLLQYINDGYLTNQNYINAIINAGYLSKSDIESGSSGSSSGGSGKKSSNKNNEVTEDATVTGTYVVISTQVEARSAHDTTSEVVSTLAAGQEIEVVATTSNGYLKLKIGDAVGYIPTEAAATKTTYDASWTEEERKEPTCTEDGYVKKKNSLSQIEETETLTATGHSFEVTDSKEATCTEDGYEIMKCTVCGEEEENVIKATGHDKGKWETVRKKGFLIPGKKVCKCTICGEVIDSETIPSTIPVWVSIVVGVILLLVIVGTVLFILDKMNVIKIPILHKKDNKTEM